MAFSSVRVTTLLPIYAGWCSQRVESCSSKSLDIIRLDLLRGTSTSIVRHELPPYVEPDVSFFIQICGDFTIARVGKDHQDMLYLIKLSTDSISTYSMKVRFLHFCI